jgi:hypothetical protein
VCLLPLLKVDHFRQLAVLLPHNWKYGMRADLDGIPFPRSKLGLCLENQLSDRPTPKLSNV